MELEDLNKAIELKREIDKIDFIVNDLIENGCFRYLCFGGSRIEIINGLNPDTFDKILKFLQSLVIDKEQEILNL